MTKLDRDIERINSGLEKVKLIVRKGRLVAQFRKPKGDGTTASTYQSLKLPALQEHLGEARALVFELDDQLSSKQFKAAQWDGTAVSQKLRYGEGTSNLVLKMGDFRDLIQESFDLKASNGDLKTPEDAYVKKYKPLLNKLKVYDKHMVVSPETLQLLLSGMPPSSRKTNASLLRQTIETMQLEKFGFNPLDITKWGRGYKKADLQKRDIPSDDYLMKIIQDNVKVPHWRWMCLMVLTFGLRPREIADCHFGKELDGVFDPDVLDVRQSKTGPRYARALPTDWIKEFNLKRVHRPVNSKGQEYGYTDALTHAANQAMSSDKKDGRGYHRKPKLVLPDGRKFDLYTFRHAYAIRGMVMGISVDDMSRYMGHSPEVHRQTYQAWMNDQHEAARWSRIQDKFKRDSNTD